MQEYLASVNQRRDLIFYLVASGLKAQHRNTVLGYFWWLLDPLLGALIYYLVVVVLFGRGGPDYGAYLLTGLIVWRWLGSTVTSACRAIVGQAGIITQVYLPKVVLPIATSLTGLASFGFGLVVLLVLLLLLGYRPGIALMWLPFVIATQALLTMVLAAAIAYACVFVRDTDTLVGHGMRLWFYGSPVIWHTEMVPARFAWVLDVNPMAVLLSSYRAIFIENHAPAVVGLLVIAAVSGVALCGVMVMYSRYEHRIVKAL